MPPESARNFKPVSRLALWPPIARAVLAQAIAAGLLLAFVHAGWRLAELSPPLWGKLALMSVAAALVSMLLALPRWWLVIQLAVPPLGYVALDSGVPGWAFGLAFLGLLLVFRNSAGDRVPLYLSNRITWRALAELAGRDAPVRFVDLGSGLGGTLFALARSNRHPESRFQGVETAPLPFAISWIRAKFSGDPRIVMNARSLWDVELTDYDVIYCFLSPEPMPALLDKAHREMRAEAILVSNSFEDPARPAPEHEILTDRRETVLHIWRGPPPKSLET